MNKLEILRNNLRDNQFNGFILPSNDAFQGEYVPPHDRRLEWLTGFTGSAGLVVILAKKAAFFTDGRYTLQASEQLDGAQYTVVNTGEMRPEQWLQAEVKADQVIGYDPWLHTESWVRRMRQSLERVGAILRPVANPVDVLWENRPEASKEFILIHNIKYTGESHDKKIENITKLLDKKHADAAIIAMPDSICWLLNIRGRDVPCTPFVLSFAVLHRSGKLDWFVDTDKVTDDIRTHLGDAVRVHVISEPERFTTDLAGKKVLLDLATTASWYADRLRDSNATIVELSDVCQLPKACKNSTEIEGMRAAHIRDGAALTQFLCWLEQQKDADITELSAAEKLAEFRKKQPLFQDLSFHTISGYGPHGAIVHYQADAASNATIMPGSLYLVDSGGQYLDGTTDVTRTIAIGPPTPEQKEHFTCVLKGHITLASAQFPEGTTGGQLDVLARYHLWQAGLDYDHGTGHGVGSYLSVHEGPQRISKVGGDVALRPGMILSNEPGYYKTGAYGIRIENLVLVVPSEAKNDSRTFLHFETLTLAPIDRHLIARELLTPDEIAWVNTYHARVREALTEHLTEEENTWLTAATASI